MRRLLAAALLVVGTGAWAQNLNSPHTLTVWFRPLALLGSEVAASVEYRFTGLYSAELGVVYAYGGRAARDEGNYVSIITGVKLFYEDLESAHTNWYTAVSGDVRFRQLGDASYGARAGLGYTRSWGRFVLGPGLYAEYGLDRSLSFGASLDTGVLAN